MASGISPPLQWPDGAVPASCRGDGGLGCAAPIDFIGSADAEALPSEMERLWDAAFRFTGLKPSDEELSRLEETALYGRGVKGNKGSQSTKTVLDLRSPTVDVRLRRIYEQDLLCFTC